MADVMKIVREWEAQRERRAATDEVSPLPDTRDEISEKNEIRASFACMDCGDHFDTRIGLAKHQGYGCGNERIPTPTIQTLPACPVCGSYALHREKDGNVTCETCGTRA